MSDIDDIMLEVWGLTEFPPDPPPEFKKFKKGEKVTIKTTLSNDELIDMYRPVRHFNDVPTPSTQNGRAPRASEHSISQNIPESPVFLRFEVGTPKIIRILSNCVYYQTFPGHSGRFKRYISNVIDRSDDTLKILTFSRVLAEEIVHATRDVDAIANVDLRVTKIGDGIRTGYSCTALEPSTQQPVPENLLPNLNDIITRSPNMSFTDSA